MGKENLEVTRFLARPETKPLIDEDGFLFDAGLRWADEPELRAHGVLTWSDIEQTSVVVLLGEPGLGKSVVLRQAYARLSKPKIARFVDLGQFSDGAHLMQGLAFEEWLSEIPAGGELHIFLDGLDECLVQVDTAARILGERLGAIPDRKLLRLRIACRTSAWSTGLERTLSSLFPSAENTQRPVFSQENEGDDVSETELTDTQVKVLELLPLRRSDAAALARLIAREQGKEFSEKRFFAAVERASVGPLAARPKTLQLLVESFLVHGALPESRWALYEQAMRFACSEVDPGRSDAMSQMSWSPDERFALAARIATALLLGNRVALCRYETTGTLAGELRVEELAEEGFIAIAGRKVTPAEVRYALRREPFPFVGHGPNHLRLSHRTEAEFLAAAHLLGSESDTEQLWTLLCAGSDGIRPQFAELAGWLASRSEALRERIMSTDPEVLLLGDVPALTEEERADITERLLQACSSRKLADSVGNWDQYLGRLAHRDLPKGLLRWLAPNQDFVARRVAMEMVWQCHPAQGRWDAQRAQTVGAPRVGTTHSNIHPADGDLAWGVVFDRLLETVFDPGEEFPLRKRAAWVICSVAGAAYCERLRPLLSGVPEDEDEELKGIALITLARWGLITLSEAFEVADHVPSSGFYGAYASFIYSEIPRLLETRDLPAALRWLRAIGVHHGESDVGGVWQEIITAAWRHSDDASIQNELVKTLIEFAKYHIPLPFDKVRRGLSWPSRKSVVERLIREGGSDVRVGFSLHYLNSILRFDDLEWLLSWHREEGSGEIRLVLREAMRTIIDFSKLEHTEALIHACEVDQELEHNFRIREAWKLDDPQIQQIRQHASARIQRTEEQIEPEQWVQQHLIASATDPKRFHNLLFALAIAPTGGRKSDPYNKALDELPGWMAADDSRRDAIRSAAVHFLTNVSPRVDDWFGKRSTPLLVLTGARAMMLLAEKLGQFDTIPLNQLSEWAMVMISHGLYVQPRVWADAVLARLAELVPGTVADAAKLLVTKGEDPRTAELVLREAPRFWCEPLSQFLQDCIKQSTLPDEQDAEAFRALVSREPNIAERFAWVRLESRSTVTNQDARARVINAALALWPIIVPVAFDKWWECVRRDELVARTVVEALAKELFWPGGIGRESLEKLHAASTETWYRWLVQAYPVETDSDFRGVRNVTPRDEAAELRDALPKVLVRRAADADVEALERLDRDFPRHGFRWAVAEARIQRRRNGWAGWPLGELWTALRNHGEPGVRVSSPNLMAVGSQRVEIPYQNSSRSPDGNIRMRVEEVFPTDGPPTITRVRLPLLSRAINLINRPAGVVLVEGESQAGKSILVQDALRELKITPSLQVICTAESEHEKLKQALKGELSGIVVVDDLQFLDTDTLGKLGGAVKAAIERGTALAILVGTPAAGDTLRSSIPHLANRLSGNTLLVRNVPRDVLKEALDKGEAKLGFRIAGLDAIVDAAEGSLWLLHAIARRVYEQFIAGDERHSGKGAAGDHGALVQRACKEIASEYLDGMREVIEQLLGPRPAAHMDEETRIRSANRRAAGFWALIAASGASNDGQKPMMLPHGAPEDAFREGLADWAASAMESERDVQRPSWVEHLVVQESQVQVESVRLRFLLRHYNLVQLAKRLDIEVDPAFSIRGEAIPVFRIPSSAVILAAVGQAEEAPDFNPEHIIHGAQSSAVRGAYLLGCFDQRVTLYAQQCRALNLVHALAIRNLVCAGKRVAVIGGGVGGLTAAVAARLAGAEVELYERAGRLCSMLRKADHRWLHPLVFDALELPLPNSTLPVLAWQAGRAQEVAKNIEEEFRRLEKELGGIRVLLNTRIRKIEKRARGVFLIDETLDVQDEFDVVVVAVGFGQELPKANVAEECMAEGPDGRKLVGTYWEPDALEGTLGHQPLLVSGSGDGALIDLARALIDDFRHDEVVTKILGDPRLESIRRRILEIDQRLVNDEKANLWQEYKNIEVPAEVVESLGIRRDANVTFNCPHAGVFDRSTAPHNRLLALLLLKARRNSEPIVQRWLGKILKIERAGVRQRVTLDGDMSPREFAIVLLRHGPDPKYFENNLPSLASDVDRQRNVLASLDLTRRLSPATVRFFQERIHKATKSSA